MDKYTLILTEKPNAAIRIATALDSDGEAEKMLEKGVPYYEAHKKERILVVPALGHLYTVFASGKKTGNRNQYPIFDYEWVPRHKAEKKANRILIWLQVIAKLAKDADVLIDACDYDLEGSIIGYCIFKYACEGREKEAKRMKYSTLAKEELENSYANLMPHLDFTLIEAGLARHEIDWLYGINLSRVLTVAAKNYSKQYATLSTGRVQGPTLKVLVAREKSIFCFVPLPYWTIKAKVKIGEAIFEVQHEKKRIEFKEEAEKIVKQCKGKIGKVENVENKRIKQLPPFPFDLGSLQTEAYRLFRYTPLRTLSIAQRLYLDALISYPRTGSQQLPPQIGYEKILKGLTKHEEFTKLAGELLAEPKLKPTEGKKQDLAHPAIYPTGKLPTKKLSTMDENVYKLIVHRFMATFAKAAIKETKKVVMDVEGEKFILNGMRTLVEGWFRVYEPFLRTQDILLPNITCGDSVFMHRIALENKFTMPPARYNSSSLLQKMEQYNLGTKATRASIMQTLYDRNYVRGEKMEVTDLGFEVTEVLQKYCPTVVSVKFTRQLEEEMNLIQQGIETKQKILSRTLNALKPIMTNLKENEIEVGKQLTYAVKQEKLRERTIGTCPTCHSGKLIVQHSKKTGKRFVGCTNYFNGTCKNSFPLPQRGIVKTTKKTCKTCGWPLVLIWSKGKRPWNLCFNNKCSASKSGKKY